MFLYKTNCDPLVGGCFFFLVFSDEILMPWILHQLCKWPFSPLFCFGCLLVFLFLCVRSVRWFWGMVVRSFARQDLC